MVKIKLTIEEYNQIIQELAERVQDCIYSNLEERLKKQTPKGRIEGYLKGWRKGDNLEISYTFAVIVNDLMQILGRIRRIKKHG